MFNLGPQHVVFVWISSTQGVCMHVVSSLCPVYFSLPTTLHLPSTTLSVGVSAQPHRHLSAWQHLRSATLRFLVVPRCRLSTLGPGALTVASPSLWNSLPDRLRIRVLAVTTSDVCWRRIYLLHCTEAFSLLEVFQDDMMYKLIYLRTHSVF